MTLGRAANTVPRIKVHDDPAARLSAYPRSIRRLAVTRLGQPTFRSPTGLPCPPPGHPGLCPADEHRQCLAGAISSFGLDALAGTVRLRWLESAYS